MRRKKPNFGAVDCYYCSEVVDMGNCELMTIEVESGRSGTSFSVGGMQTLVSKKPFKPTLRVYSGRKYYRNKEVYVCHECLAQERKSNQTKMKWAFAFMVLAIGYAVYMNI